MYEIPEALKKEIEGKVSLEFQEEIVDDVRYLTSNPDRIDSAWSLPYETEGGSLFRMVHVDGACAEGDWIRPDGEECGCLTQIKESATAGGFSEYVAYTDELTQEILNDSRLPYDPKEITVEHLPVFAEWMLRLAVKLKWEEASCG